MMTSSSALTSSVFAPLPHFTRPTFLMCPPEFYDVDYVINPWMAGNLHQPSRDTAFMQWKNLYRQLQRVADVRLLHAREGAPDMVFVAHAAVVQHGLAAVSSFAHPQRQTEEGHLRKWLQDAGFLLWETPRETCFEGEGDALFDANGGHLWAAHGVRTCRHSHRHLGDAWHTRVTSLHLVDPRFYHLDLCFAPLSGEYLLYFPSAFDAASLEKIHSAYGVDKRIVVSELEATQFGCNVINVGRDVLLGAVETNLAKRLMERGFDVTEMPLGEFQRGGGSAKALALRLSDSALALGDARIESAL
ncbi:dimethylarginine dimethylaminohydrolase family protein [Tunturibacter empetritectus]|uniref:N-dimethylarginine dimethylaminohydrolase n=1 Tax=Tunturiibacter empetritectus TaxID=3069691 RepID=A0A7W8MPT0_9BACT|nr:arginine deiminase-related protein [Edaphobacter lichenicola]MBB5315793.1 N-dimethylarginine dimethylaminohydrolase [Edaphobacter lichenicola]